MPAGGPQTAEQVMTRALTGCAILAILVLVSALSLAGFGLYALASS